MASKNGFSLIELMVVIAIVAILAAVAIPSYHTYRIKVIVSKDAKLIADTYIPIIQSYYDLNGGNFPVSAITYTSPYPWWIEWDGSQIFSRYGSTDGNTPPEIAGRQINFVPTVSSNGGVVTWTCTTPDPSYAAGQSLGCKYLPANCQNGCTPP